MPSRDEERRRQAERVDSLEYTVFQHLYDSLAKWLSKVLARILAPFRMFHVKPDPTAVWSLTQEWQKVADHIAFDHLGAVADVGGNVGDSGRGRVSGNSFVQAQLARTHNLLMRVPDDVYHLVFAEISDGVNAGESTSEIASRVERALSGSAELWVNRARTIARTETIRAYNAGALGSGLRAQDLEQVRMLKEWLSTEDTRTRDSHREVDGQQRLLLEPFRVGGSSLMMPGDPTAPPEEVINCVTGSAKIKVAGLQAAYRFVYSGPFVTLTGEHGLFTTVSPNHPILTENGWRPACQINKGDYVVTALLSDELPGAQPNIDGSDVTAEQIYDTVALLGRSYGVGGLAVDFHGDVPNSQVDVVFSDRMLSYGFDPLLLEELEKFFFSCSNAPTASGGTVFEFSVRATDPPSGCMSFLHLISSLIGGHSTPLQRLGFTLRTSPDAGTIQATSDGRSTDPECTTEGQFALSGQVALRKIFEVNLYEVHDLYLYTFATSSGIYVADGIVTHNCRCTMLIKEA